MGGLWHIIFTIPPKKVPQRIPNLIHEIFIFIHGVKVNIELLFKEKRYIEVFRHRQSNIIVYCCIVAYYFICKLAKILNNRISYLPVVLFHNSRGGNSAVCRLLVIGVRQSDM
jgi:hypothetical protein